MTSRAPCRQWQRTGTCRFNADCRFLHLEDAAHERVRADLPREDISSLLDVSRLHISAQASSSSVSSSSRRADQETIAARERREEAARKRQEESHAAYLAREEARERARIRHEEQRLAREEAARRQYEERQAAREEAARKRHEEYLLREEAREQARQRRAAHIAREATAADTYIVAQYTLVEFGAGLEIRNVVAGFDLCRVTIRNLPLDATRREIAEIFLAQGVPSANFLVLPLKRHGNGNGRNKQEAVVWVDATQGQLIAVGLEGVEFRDERLTFEVGDNANWNIGRRLPFLTVSWYAPSEVIDATYSTMRDAKSVMDSINSTIWKGRAMKAMINEKLRRTEYDFPSVRILGCPIGSRLDIEFINFLRTSSVRVAHTVHFDEAATERWVWETLRSMRGAQRQTCVRQPRDAGDGETSYRIEFDTYKHGKKAYDYILTCPSGRDNCATLRPWLPKPNQHVTAIPLMQYDVQKRQWDDLAEKRDGVDAYVRVTQGTADKAELVFINIVGEDKKAAGPLKVRVENLIAGEKLDPTTHWHPSFTEPKEKAHFDYLSLIYRVYIRHDLKARCLRIYGRRTSSAAVAIAHRAKLLSAEQIVKEIDRQELRYFVREGLGKLQELIGEENAELDVTSLPARIQIKNTAEAEHHLQRLLIESRHKRFESSQKTSSAGQNVCPICTDDASNPEQLGCGHTYCSACLKHFLTTAAAFPLVCIGDDGKCQVPLALPFIIRFLPPHVFRAHLETAFAAHIERHSRELKYCTTPDCTQIYRRRRDVQELQCPSCFSSICAACDAEAHEGMTCEERRIYRDPALQERLNAALAEEQGWKSCPLCYVIIEKFEGCNHVECRCGAHICWKCLGVFDKDTVYDHLRNEHDGMVFDAVPQGVDVGPNNPNAFVADQRDELQRLEQEQRRRNYFDQLLRRGY